ncbi:MAG: GGDEF domain-containing protein [Burkholderiaceae bacterium]
MSDDIDALTQQLIQRGETDRAMALASDALRQAEGAPRARALLALASACNTAGRFADALRAALAADALYRGCGDDAGSAEALLRAAHALRAAGDHAAAVELLERVEQQARALGDTALLAQTLRQIGICSSMLGRHQHAFSCLTEAQAMFAEAGGTSDRLHARLSLLNARNRQAEPLPPGDANRAVALEALLPAWAALAADCDGPAHRRLRAMALGNRAITLHQLGRSAEAAEALQALLPEYQALGMRPNEGLCLAEWAHCLRGLGRLDEARDRYRAAIAVLDVAGTVEDRLAAREGLAETEEGLGDMAAALAALKQARQLERRGTADAAQAAVLQRELRIELARLTSQWAREASEDPLTGLGNRRALQAWLRDHLPRVEQGEPLSLVLLDLDHFKQVNDRHGHGVGDEVLQQVARLMAQGCRGRDRAVRYGGEEFVLALAGAARHEAAEVAERLRQTVADQAWGRVSPGLRVTASLGVADATEAAEPQALLTLADRRLYAAKLGGRNRVVVSA